MSGPVTFTLDGREVEAQEGETIWTVAKRTGTMIPHLCHLDQPGYRPDGNCRACMVEIEGERVLAASCIRRPTEGMVVDTAGDRSRKAREMVFELLAADMPAREASPDDKAQFWTWMDRMGVKQNRRYAEGPHEPAQDQGDQHGHSHASQIPLRDVTHPAMAVNLDACIRCGLCVRACREVQVNDVIGMGERGDHALPIFDFADPMGDSTCVACGECVQACPTGALFEKSLMDEDWRTREVEPDRYVDSVCPYCGVGCQTRVAVKDDRIVQVDGRDGPANENRLCVKGRFGYDYVMSPERLTKPLVRRDDAPKRGDIRVDPLNPWDVFREATWEEAMERAAGGLGSIRDTHGGGALSGFGSAKGSNEEAYLFQKLVRAGFGTNNVDHCTRLCHASSVAALMEGVGSGAVSAPFGAVDDADCVIIIGARPNQNHPVAATYFKQAAKRGTKLIVIDPRGQEMNRFAEYALQFKPGTDVALLNAMLNVIVEEKLYDQQYVQAHVDGFEALAAKVRDFPPEAMEAVCGIDAQTIREVARLYAKSERSIIFWGMGISQHVHGTDNSRCLIALALITGHIGRPGTGLHPLRGQNNVQGASDAGLIPMYFADYKSVENPDVRGMYEDAWGRQLDPQRGLTVVEIMDAVMEGEIRGMYVMGENPAMSDPDQTHAREALAKLDCLVVQDIFLTETAWHADVVLPASAHAEKLGTYTNTNREVQIGRPAIPLPGEARQDLGIIIDLANRLGLDWRYDGPAEVYEEMRALMPSLDNISWSRVEREGAVTYPAKAEDMPGEAIIFTDGFPTKDGRGKLVPADLVPPDELPDAEYPFVLTTGRLLEHWHTGAMTRRAKALDAIEPEAQAMLHPRDLTRLGLAAGDAVTVMTRRGEISMIARADRDVPEGMVFTPFCWVEAPANVLTNPKLDPYGKIPEFKVCAARVERADA
ncbi:NAD-dependent formate dehydrogenase catalytic subunit /NAD-dependent formate dehydrogenase iron-sulfur protein [Palleronia marisminoris]|uniref:Putative formate dehydrogenase n=1 Tax=Palleronia marisminoris TaxID=315423 RepID=A0A1Y5SGB5_9RHOB|nr:formate dehydrogenase subunit alpha [Palleronia marisminoris]SFG72466.1 NAD-dependent formate dehydrogenase catalytic subunit /NAD-dependent formate dehydrogenase iron-sulfur protein [Palleronia marisminoris]SLN37058.1 Putative formate dehydrogenase [Palleronia marisminoris]